MLTKQYFFFGVFVYLSFSAFAFAGNPIFQGSWRGDLPGHANGHFGDSVEGSNGGSAPACTYGVTNLDFSEARDADHDFFVSLDMNFVEDEDRTDESQSKKITAYFLCSQSAFTRDGAPELSCQGDGNSLGLSIKVYSENTATATVTNVRFEDKRVSTNCYFEVGTTFLLQRKSSLPLNFIPSSELTGSSDFFGDWKQYGATMRIEPSLAKPYSHVMTTLNFQDGVNMLLCQPQLKQGKVVRATLVCQPAEFSRWGSLQFNLRSDSIAEVDGMGFFSKERKK